MSDSLPLELSPISQISQLKALLEMKAYQVEIEPLSGSPRFKQLLVGPLAYINASGSQDPQRQLTLKLAWLNDLYQAAGRRAEAYSDFLQLSLELPFEVPASQLNNVCSLMSHYNLLMPCGHFFMDSQGQLAMCYRLKSPKTRQLSAQVILEALEQLLYYINLLAGNLEALTLGQLNLEQAVERSEKALAGLP